MMKSLGFARENGAGFVGVIADGDDVIEFLSGEFVHVFRAMACNVNADFAHDLNRFRAHEAGFGPGAVDFKPVPTELAQ